MPKIRLLHVWVATGDSWSRQSVGNAKNWLLLVLGRDRVLFWFCVTIGIPVSRHGSQILINRNCRNMAFLCCDKGLVLCHDDVAT